MKFRPTNELWLVIHCGTHMSEMTLELDVEDFRVSTKMRSNLLRSRPTYMGAYEWARTTDDWRKL